MTPVAGLTEELIHSHTTAFYDLRLRYQMRPEDGDAFDVLFRYPVVHFGVIVGDLSHVDLHRQSSTYRSTLGYTIAAYYGFERFFFQRKRWALGYDIFNGVSFNTRPYDAFKNVDNEYIGAHLSIFLGLGLTARYRITPQWTLSASIDFKHYSAASMVRPNLGVNSFGPTVGVTYDFAPQSLCAPTELPTAQRAADVRHEDARRFYCELTAAVVPKALPDEYNYLVAQNASDPSRCPVYVGYNTMLSAMYRYRLHHATGIAIDYSYLPYVNRLKELDAPQNHDVIDGRLLRYSPHVLGFGVRHDVIYRHLSINLGLGLYARRRMGWRAETQESPFYQFIGINYALPCTHDRLFAGFMIKAFRFSKVDGMYFGLGWRFRKK